jgi:hypothetical protein
VSVIVSVCCNDPDNGLFAGRLWRVDYADMELSHDDWERGCAFSYHEPNVIKVSRRLFIYKQRKEWFGNWCWDALWMSRDEARRLVRYLCDSGVWSCEAGPSRLFEWFHNRRDALNTAASDINSL